MTTSPADRTARRHALALVATAAALPLGEGAAWAGLAALAACLVARRRALRAAPPALVARPLFVALGVWLLAGLIAAPASGLGWLRPAELLRWAPLLALPLILGSVRLLGAAESARAAQAFCLALGVAALFAVAQFVLDVRPGEGLIRAEAGMASQALVPGSARAAAGGFYFHRLKMAHVLMVGLAGLGARLVLVPLSWRRRLAEGSLWALWALALAMTFTRAALAGVAAGVGLCLLWAGWRVRAAALAAGAALVAVISALPGPGRARLVSLVAPGAPAARAELWQHALTMVQDHPWGVGLGNYGAMAGRYIDGVDPDLAARAYPHSLLLAAWAEAGPLGLLGMLGAFAAVIAACAAALGRGRQRGVAAATLAGSVALWTVGLTHDVLFHPPVSLTAMSLWGWGLAQLDPPAAA